MANTPVTTAGDSMATEHTHCESIQHDGSAQFRHDSGFGTAGRHYSPAAFLSHSSGKGHYSALSQLCFGEVVLLIAFCILAVQINGSASQ